MKWEPYLSDRSSITTNEVSVFQTQWVAESLAKDCRTCIHLFHKLPESLYDCRPTEGQRTTTELLRYLAVSSISALRGFREPDKGWRDHYLAKSKEMSPSQFPELMESQAVEILEYFRDLPDEDLATREVRLPWGDVMPLGLAILYGPAKWLPGYKMQLFQSLPTSGTVGIRPSSPHRR